MLIKLILDFDTFHPFNYSAFLVKIPTVQPLWSLFAQGPQTNSLFTKILGTWRFILRSMFRFNSHRNSTNQPRVWSISLASFCWSSYAGQGCGWSTRTWLKFFRYKLSMWYTCMVLIRFFQYHIFINCLCLDLP